MRVGFQKCRSSHTKNFCNSCWCTSTISGQKEKEKENKKEKQTTEGEVSQSSVSEEQLTFLTKFHDENIQRVMKKGNLIGLEGRIQTGSYEGQEGKRVYTSDVVADSILEVHRAWKTINLVEIQVDYIKGLHRGNMAVITTSRVIQEQMKIRLLIVRDQLR